MSTDVHHKHKHPYKHSRSFCNTGNLPGDVLMAVVFVCYAGPFTADFRAELLSQRWIPDLQSRGIPCTEGAQPLDVLTTSAEKVRISSDHHVPERS